MALLTAGPTLIAVPNCVNPAVSAAAINQSGSLSAVTLITSPFAGFYEVLYYLEQTANCSNCSGSAQLLVIPSFTWTDESAISATQTWTGTGLKIVGNTGEAVDTGSLNNISSFPIFMNAASVLQVAVTESGSGGTGVTWTMHIRVTPAYHAAT